MAILERKTIELGKDLFIDVDPDVEFVEIRIGDSAGVKVNKVDLWAACFTIADAATQERLMPVRKTEVATFIRIHNVKLKKDMRAGEILKVHCNVNVPQTIEEGLSGNLMKKRSSIILPETNTPNL